MFPFTLIKCSECLVVQRITKQHDYVRKDDRERIKLGIFKETVNEFATGD